jgi:hypothetical protein
VRIGPRLEAFLGEVNPVVLGTTRRDGSVHLTPLWYEYREGSVWINGAASRDWLVHLRRDDRVSLLIVDRQRILRRAEILGRVARSRPTTTSRRSTDWRSATVVATSAAGASSASPCRSSLCARAAPSSRNRGTSTNDGRIGPD